MSACAPPGLRKVAQAEGDLDHGAAPLDETMAPHMEIDQNRCVAGVEPEVRETLHSDRRCCGTA